MTELDPLNPATASIYYTADGELAAVPPLSLEQLADLVRAEAAAHVS